MHASNVALIRNLTTGRISPQFHVVFDNWFETISTDSDEIPPVWDVLVTTSQFEANVDAEELEGYQLDDEWLSKEEVLERRVKENKFRQRQLGGKQRSSATTVPVPLPATTQVQQGSSQPAVETVEDAEIVTPVEDGGVDEFPLPDLKQEPAPPVTGPTRRSTRARRAPQRYGYDGTGVGGYLAFQTKVQDLLNDVTEQPSAQAAIAYWTLVATDPDSGQ